ncbi:hypothetical protein C8A05DRAFT_40061, partial [Staphylotrichum tortipilum]
VEDLKRKVSRELSEQLRAQADVPGTEEFTKWAELFQKLWDRQQEAAHYDKLRPGPKNTQHNQFRPHQEASNAQQTNGDPMQLDAVRRSFVSKEQCQANGLCFYCKKAGHIIGECEEKKRADSRFGTPSHHPASPAPRGYQQAPRPQYPRQQFQNSNRNFLPRDIPIRNWQNNRAQFQSSSRFQHVRTAGYVTGEVDSETSDSTGSPTPGTPTPGVNGNDNFYATPHQGNE